MSWRFRKSFKILPGLKLNLSKSGLSVSIGGAPFTVNLSSRGAHATASIPGTGIQFRQRIDKQSGSNARTGFIELPIPKAPSVLDDSHFFPIEAPEVRPLAPVGTEIRSASIEKLTSEKLREIEWLIEMARQEQADITLHLGKANEERARAEARFNAWDRGFLLKRIFKTAFESRRIISDLAAARTRELEEQLQLTEISTQVHLESHQAELFYRFRDDFAALSECAAIWDVKRESAVDQARERTLAKKSVTRQKVQLCLTDCDLVHWHEQIPHIENANGGDMFLYPGFILYRVSKSAFSVIDFHDVELTTALVNFHEEESVPPDSKVLGKTWAKTNKDGSRDKRFADNREIPIALYGELTFSSKTGLWEKFHLSDHSRLERFAASWKLFAASFGEDVSYLDGGGIILRDGQSREMEPSLNEDIIFECTDCGQRIAVNAEAFGQEFPCPVCRRVLVVPTKRCDSAPLS